MRFLLEGCAYGGWFIDGSEHHYIRSDLAEPRKCQGAVGASAGQGQNGGAGSTKSQASGEFAPDRCANAAPAPACADRYAQRVKSLERERDRLKTQLAEAEAQIARLEESRRRGGQPH